MSAAPKSEAGPAILDVTRTYRYTLTRVWDEDRPRVAFIGLNPSTADENRLDPTLRRCLRFADDWGYGSFVMLNLFAFRATDPMAMKRAPSPVGPENDRHIREHTRAAEMTVACWGTHGCHHRRDEILKIFLREWGINVHHLGLTQGGCPKHPLYLPSATVPQQWSL